MTEPAPLYIDIDLPDRVILRDEAMPTGAAPLPTLHPNDAEAIWYRAHPDAMTLDAKGAIAAWRAENDLGTLARPVDPNDGNARLAPGGGVAFIREVNGGFIVDAALVEAERFCCAVRLASPESQARTLVTLNPPDGDTYLFLSEKDGMIEWRDDAGTVEVSMPSPGAEMWVLAGYDHGRLMLSAAKPGTRMPPVQFSTATSAGLAAALSGANDLFIGCRSHRKGILKTLGSATIFDVLLWLDRDCAAPEGAEKIAQACRFVDQQGGAA